MKVSLVNPSYIRLFMSRIYTKSPDSVPSSGHIAGYKVRYLIPDLVSCVNATYIKKSQSDFLHENHI